MTCEDNLSNGLIKICCNFADMIRGMVGKTLLIAAILTGGISVPAAAAGPTLATETAEVSIAMRFLVSLGQLTSKWLRRISTNRQSLIFLMPTTG